MGHREHRYTIATRWTGNTGAGTSAYAAYSRNHELNAPGKAAPISGSSDAAFRGDRSRYNPEELLLGALSTCHMLWVLHLSADAGIVITDYTDNAEAVMREGADGSGEFTRVMLRPRVTIADGSRCAEAAQIHHRAHELCFIARSVKFEVACEPEIVAAAALG